MFIPEHNNRSLDIFTAMVRYSMQWHRHSCLWWCLVQI